MEGSRGSGNTEVARNEKRNELRLHSEVSGTRTCPYIYTETKFYDTITSVQERLNKWVKYTLRVLSHFYFLNFPRADFTSSSFAICSANSLHADHHQSSVVLKTDATRPGLDVDVPEGTPSPVTP